MKHLQGPILLTGISVRMLAEMAVNAGYEVCALDYFGDSDLQALCPSYSLLRDEAGAKFSPATLVALALRFDTPYIVYNASFENHPQQVARLAQGRRLLGNTPETLVAVRDPKRLAEVLEKAGFAFPQMISVSEALPLNMEQDWLWKPIRSGGGHSIRRWTGQPVTASGYLQVYIAGMIGSASFVANGETAVLLGITEQLVGQAALGATGFRYCGNLLPSRLPEAEQAALVDEADQIIRHLTTTFGLQGLNSLDFVWSAGRVWTLEVNPRPSASMELIDLAYDLRLFDLHVRSFYGEMPDFSLQKMRLLSPSAMGKGVLFASQPLTLGDTSHWRDDGLRDIPHSGESIAARHPICTILTTAPFPEICWQQLSEKAVTLEREFITDD